MPERALTSQSTSQIEDIRRDGQQIADALETLWVWAGERDTDPDQRHPMIGEAEAAGAALQRLLERVSS